MPIKTHLWMSIAAQVLGFLIGGVVFAVFMFSGRATGVLFPLLFFGCIGGGYEIARLIFRSLVHAQCPKCGGEAFQTGRRPIIYVCRACGHSERTMVSEGKEPLMAGAPQPAVQQPQSSKGLLVVFPPIVGYAIGGFAVGAVIGYVNLMGFLASTDFPALGARIGLRLELADVFWLAPSLGAIIGVICGIIGGLLVTVRKVQR